MNHQDDNPLAQLLLRDDIWQGQNTLKRGAVNDSARWATGYPTLDQALLLQGWPLGQLIEICQPHSPYCEWRLWGSAAARCTQQKQIMVLLNPPASPLLSGLTEFAINPSYLWLIQAKQRQDFIPTLSELLTTGCIAGVLAWEPQRPLSYTELRKIQLTNLHSDRACCLFRNQNQRHHSSPAALRLWVQLQAKHIGIDIFKQKGRIHTRNLTLPLPHTWTDHWQTGVNSAREVKVLAFPFSGNPQ